MEQFPLPWNNCICGEVMRESEILCKQSQHFQWAPAVLVAVAALPSFLGFNDPPVYISPPVLRGRGHAEESSHGQGKEGSGGRMGLRHPVPFGGEWLQVAELEGRNTLCVLARAAWTQINPWTEEKRQTMVCNCSKLPRSLRTSSWKPFLQMTGGRERADVPRGAEIMQQC